jgi:hypothetical protein
MVFESHDFAAAVFRIPIKVAIIVNLLTLHSGHRYQCRLELAREDAGDLLVQISPANRVSEFT